MLAWGTDGIHLSASSCWCARALWEPAGTGRDMVSYTIVLVWCSFNPDMAFQPLCPHMFTVNPIRTLCIPALLAFGVVMRCWAMSWHTVKGQSCAGG